MTDLDRLLQEAAKNPSAGIRNACADALREENEPELGDAVEGNRGEELLTRAGWLSQKTGLHLGIKLLWCAYHVIPRLREMGSSTGTITTSGTRRTNVMPPQIVPTHTRPGEAPVPDAGIDEWRRLARDYALNRDDLPPTIWTTTDTGRWGEAEGAIAVDLAVTLASLGVSAEEMAEVARRFER